MKEGHVVVSGDPRDPQVKGVLELLDRSGLAYRVTLSRSRPSGVTLTQGGDCLRDFSHSKLVDFLWAHGAKFEDS